MKTHVSSRARIWQRERESYSETWRRFLKFGMCCAARAKWRGNAALVDKLLESRSKHLSRGETWARRHLAVQEVNHSVLPEKTCAKKTAFNHAQRICSLCGSRANNNVRSDLERVKNNLSHGKHFPTYTAFPGFIPCRCCLLFLSISTN